MTYDDASLTLKRQKGLQLLAGPAARQEWQKLEAALVFFSFFPFCSDWMAKECRKVTPCNKPRVTDVLGVSGVDKDCLWAKEGERAVDKSQDVIKKEKEQLIRARMLWGEIKHAHREITWLWTVEMLLCLLALRRWRWAGGAIASRSWVIHGLPTVVIYSNIGPKKWCNEEE